MIEYSNIRRYENLPFEQYLQLPGYSHSFLKNERNGVAPKINVTPKMRLGTMVDSILTEGKADITDPIYPAAKKIAEYLKANFGSLLSVMKKQISYTATVSHAGFSMQTTGRADFEIPAIANIDLKITDATDLQTLVYYMGYNNQIWHYGRCGKVPNAYIMAYSTKTKKLLLPLHKEIVGNYNQFWAEKILKFGKLTN